jgi:hypothetical protein
LMPPLIPLNLRRKGRQHGSGEVKWTLLAMV